MRKSALWVCLLGAGVVAGASAGWVAPVLGGSGEVADAAVAGAGQWSPKAAAEYLDRREVWWQGWESARKDHGTICISCHTTVPYAMARPLLRGGLRAGSPEADATPEEKVMLASVEKRVNEWPEMVPFYNDAEHGKGKTAQSHATEAVMNAVILGSYDAGKAHLRPVTRAAFEAAFALQEETGESAGGWIWQDFHLAPWESGESSYQGAALLLLEASEAPDGFAREPGTRAHLDRLRGYLRAHYEAQPMMNKLYVLWDSAHAQRLLTSDERKALIAAAKALEQPDGGWRLASLDGRERLDHTAQPSVSDGYATALVVLALEEAKVGKRDKAVADGRAWLEGHQRAEGDWRTASLNKERDPESNIGRFMSDAATGYAVMALEEGR